MTRRQAAFIVASGEVARAKDWEYSLWSNPKVPRAAVKKAKLETHAAQMRANRIITTPYGSLPGIMRAAIRAKVKA